MRPAPPSFDPQAWTQLEEARGLLSRGDGARALEVYARVWDACVRKSDHYHACVVAHMAGVAEGDPAKKHLWNVRAVAEADAVVDRNRVMGTYASNLNNLGMTYAQLGNNAQALETFERALRHVSDLEPGPYADQVRAGIERNLARLPQR